MRTVPDGLAAALSGGGAKLCHVWLLIRRDGTRLAFTDHDRDLTVDDLTAKAASGMSPGAADSALGFSAGSASAAGVLDDAAISDTDIEAGLYDAAGVECRLVDWSDTTLAVSLWRGTISRIKRAGGGFTAEIEGPLAALDKVVGRTFGRLCDANLGDARCAVTASHPAFSQGCDKLYATCGARFSNTLNFRGFPTIPGDDFLLVSPGGGQVNDGTSRNG